MTLQVTGHLNCRKSSILRMQMTEHFGCHLLISVIISREFRYADIMKTLNTCLISAITIKEIIH